MYLSYQKKSARCISQRFACLFLGLLSGILFFNYHSANLLTAAIAKQILYIYEFQNVDDSQMLWNFVIKDSESSKSDKNSGEKVGKVSYMQELNKFRTAT